MPNSLAKVYGHLKGKVRHSSYLSHDISIICTSKAAWKVRDLPIQLNSCCQKTMRTGVIEMKPKQKIRSFTKVSLAYMGLQRQPTRVE